MAANDHAEVEVKKEKHNGESAMQRRGSWFPSLRGESPFMAMRQMAEEMEKMFDEWDLRRSFVTPFIGRQSFSKRLEEFGKRMYLPDIEVLDRDGRFVVRVDLPGISRKDLNVEVSERELVISGERQENEEESKKGFYRTERAYGSFYRSIALPEGVDADSAKAKFNDGVLEISMKSARKNNVKKLDIS